MAAVSEEDKAGAATLWGGLHRAEDDPWCDNQDQAAIAAGFARIRAEEREACAVIVETEGRQCLMCGEIRDAIAAAIRSRGEGAK